MGGRNEKMRELEDDSRGSGKRSGGRGKARARKACAAQDVYERGTLKSVI